jgi:microcystin-dependent protein
MSKQSLVRVVLSLGFAVGIKVARAGELGAGTPDQLALGDSNAQLVYTPVLPCRLIDTRAAGGSLAPGTVRDFKVAGSGLGPQGGNPAGCGIPVGRATAVVVNFVAVNPTGPGNLRAWAYSDPPAGPPAASLINYTAASGAIANGVVVPICDPARTECPGLDLRVQADVSATHLVADALGFFERFPIEQAVPPGTILEFGGVAVPAGFLPCDGTLVSRAQYPRLFAAIGTAFGAGDGVTTFHLPDFRGRFARGRDGGAGRDPEAGGRGPSNGGGNAGDAVGSLQGDQFRSHRHFVSNAAGLPASVAGAEFTTQTAPQFPPIRFTDYAGGSETRPVNVYVNKIIRY